MWIVLAVAAGGALGAATRYSVDRVIELRVLTVFPWSTWTVNITGCFLAGLLVAALVDRHDLPPWLRTGLVFGVLGGYTTFSTFAQEALDLIEGGHIGLALAYSSGSVVAGMAAVWFGALLGRAL